MAQRTVAELIKALQDIENQDQPIISVLVIAEDLFGDDDEPMTVEEFTRLIDDHERFVNRAIDDAYEGIQQAIY